MEEKQKTERRHAEVGDIGPPSPPFAVEEAARAAPGAKDGGSGRKRRLTEQERKAVKALAEKAFAGIRELLEDDPALDAGKVAPGPRAVFNGFNLAGIADSCGFHCDILTVAADWNRFAQAIWKAIPEMLAPPVELPPVEVGPLPHLAEALSQVTGEGEVRARNSDVALAHSAFVSATPLVHSTLLEMIGLAATGKCMACGWPLKASEDQGCVHGNCSFRPGEHSQEYPRWWQRTQILTLARKYVAGELGNHNHVQDAAMGEAAVDPHGDCLMREGNALAEVQRLTALINTPEIIDFVKAVQIEAVHQRERWGTEQDEGKTAADWFWLLGYLAGKALHSDKVGDQKKLLHHIITTAAACANWHAQVLGKCDMRPGIATPSGEKS